jgi:DNA polymerase-3 subunit delta
MIKSLIGENSFAIDSELRAIVVAYQKDFSDLGIERIDAEEEPYARIEEATTSLNLFARDKLVILNTPSKNKDFLDHFEELVKNMPQTTSLVIVEQKLDKRLSFYKNLKKLTDFKEMNEPDQNSLLSWLVRTAKDHGGTLSRQDASYLCERVGHNQQRLSNELTKLVLYNDDVSRKTIDILTEQTPQSNVFQLLEAAFSGNKNQALGLYKEQRSIKVEPASIIAMLTWQLHIIAVIVASNNMSIDQIAKESKLNPYVLRKSQAIARHHSLSDIRGLLSELLQIDVSIKSTNIDADESLQLFLLKLSN